jgi:hypothetical protein
MAEARSVDLRQVRTGVINLDFQSRRRHRARNALTKLGLDFSFISGIADKPRHLGCSQSHLKAIETLRAGGTPFLVLEDDAIPTPFYTSHVEIPTGVDLLYLGHSPYGWSRQLNGTPEITGPDPDGFLRVHSMLAAHAILYVTEAGVEAVAASIRRSISGDAPERHDIGLCDLQQVLDVRATVKPLFCQSADVQGAKKRDQRKELENFVALPRSAGDVVVSAVQELTVVETTTGRLEFRLQDATLALPNAFGG